MLLLLILPLVLMLKSERKVLAGTECLYNSVPRLHLCPESPYIWVSHHLGFFSLGLESYLLLSVSPSDWLLEDRLSPSE